VSGFEGESKTFEIIIWSKKMREKREREKGKKGRKREEGGEGDCK
jgi:hypothetical protein